MAMRNCQIFHDYFYEPEMGRKQSNVSYSGLNFYSWNTQIGRRYRDANGTAWFFLADYHFSNTTASHRGFLRRACPYGDEWIIEVPFTWNDSFSDNESFIETMRKRFEAELVEHFEERTKANAKLRREIYKKIFSYRKFMSVVGEKIPKRFDKKLADLESFIEDAPEAKEKRRKAKAHRKEEFLKRRKATIARSDKLIKSVGGILKAAYLASFDSFKEFEQTIREQVRTALHARYDRWDSAQDMVTGASFVFPGPEGTIHTTQGIGFPAELAKKLLERFMNGEKFKEGMHIGNYVLMELNDQYAKIGCHLIPIDNIKALADYYGIKTAAC